MARAIKEFLKGCIDRDAQWKIVLLKHWDDIIGPMKENVSLEYIKNNRLYLGVTHPAWAQELFLLSPILKKKINQLLKKELIK